MALGAWMVGLLLAGPQADGEVERIMLRFFQQRPKAQTPEQFKQLLGSTRSELEKFLKDHPKHKDAEKAAFHVAESHLSAEELEPGLEKLRLFLRDYPASTHGPAVRFYIGEVFLQLEKYPEARAAFQEFVKHHGTHERVLFAQLYVAVTLQNERRYDEAAAQLLEARQQHKDRKESWSAMLQLAVLRHVSGRNDEARAALEEIVRACPEEGPREVARRHLTEYVKLDKEAPAFAQKDTQGAEFSLEKQRGKVVVLYFFDSSIEAAKAEAGFLRRTKEAFKADALQIVGVSLDRERRDLTAFIAQGHASWPLLFDGRGFDGAVPLLYGVRGLPALWVLDRKGKLRFFNLAGPDLRHALERLIQEK